MRRQWLTEPKWKPSIRSFKRAIFIPLACVVAEILTIENFHSIRVQTSWFEPVLISVSSRFSTDFFSIRFHTYSFLYAKSVTDLERSITRTSDAAIFIFGTHSIFDSKSTGSAVHLHGFHCLIFWKLDCLEFLNWNEFRITRVDIAASASLSNAAENCKH